MAKFTEFNAPAGVAGPTAGRSATAADFGGGAGAGLQNFAGSLAKFSQQIQAKEERADVTHVQTLQSSALADLTGSIAQLENDAELGAPGHIDAVKNLVGQYYTDRQDQAQTKKGQLLFQRQQAAVLSHFTVAAITFQSGSLGAKVKADFNIGLDHDKKTLLHDPDLLSLILSFQTGKIENRDGAIATALNAKETGELAQETSDALGVAAVRGFIRRNPEQALIDLESGAFDDVVDSTDINPLRREAEQGLKGLRAADSAEIKRLKELRDAAVLEEQNKLFNELTTGKDEDGNDISLLALSQKVMGSSLLNPFGLGSKNSFIKAIKLRASGQSSAEFDKAVDDQQTTYLRMITTGLNLDGSPVDVAALREDILDDKIIDAFGSKGSKATLLRLLDNMAAGVDTPLSKREQEIYRMVTTKTDINGTAMTDAQINKVIDDDKLLPVDGAAGKKAFRTMVRDKAKMKFAATAGVTENDVYLRLLLPVGDPNRLTPDDLLDPDLIAKVGGFAPAEKLRQIAIKIRDKKWDRIEKTINEFASRFQGRITDSLLGGKLDSEGGKTRSRCSTADRKRTAGVSWLSTTSPCGPARTRLHAP